jgi:archaellum component FlaC
LTISISVTTNAQHINVIGDVDNVKSYESCVSDCKIVIEAARKTIAARDLEISDLNKSVKDLGVEINTVSKDRDSWRDSEGAWYHNPFILVPLGVLAGGVGVLWLGHK